MSGYFPGTEGIESSLRDFWGKSVYLIEFRDGRQKARGNNGDLLIDFAFQAILARLNMRLVTDVKQADILCVRPGGALLQHYLAPKLLASRLAQLPDLPLIIFPHSSWFPSQDPAELFGSRRSSVHWLSRERYSHDHLRGQWGVSLAKSNVDLVLDHDVVISAHENVRQLLESQPKRPRSSDTLLVSRLGVEALDMQADPTKLPAGRSLAGLTIAKAVAQGLSILPPSMRRVVRRRMTARRQRAANIGSLTRLQQSGLTLGSVGGYDISDPGLASFDDFLQIISSAVVVATNRLHVAVPAAILGYQTYLLDSGYHKLRGVYAHSLSEAPQVQLIPSRS